MILFFIQLSNIDNAIRNIKQFAGNFAKEPVILILFLLEKWEAV